MFKIEYLQLYLVARGAYDLLTDDWNLKQVAHAST